MMAVNVGRRASNSRIVVTCPALCLNKIVEYSVVNPDLLIGRRGGDIGPA
jgi:hypothetical protein